MYIPTSIYIYLEILMQEEAGDVHGAIQGSGRDGEHGKFKHILNTLIIKIINNNNLL